MLFEVYSCIFIAKDVSLLYINEFCVSGRQGFQLSEVDEITRPLSHLSLQSSRIYLITM